MTRSQSNSAPYSSSDADRPTERSTPHRSVGAFLSSLFTRKPDRWYSEEDVLADLEHCSQGRR